MHLDLARAFDTQGEADKAIAQYQKAVDLYASQGPRWRKGDPKTRARLERRLGTAYDRLGRFAEAEAHYQQALKLAPRDALVWNDAGYSQYVQGNWKAAEGRLKKAVSLDPTNHRFRTNLGLALAAAGRIDDAILVLEQAGGKASAHVNVGYILAAQGNVDAARQNYKAALELEPGLKHASAALAKLETQKPRRDDSAQLASGTQAK
jgi:Flp pilus assembly protein TadD